MKIEQKFFMVMKGYLQTLWHPRRFIREGVQDERTIICWN